MADATQDLAQQVFGGQIWNCYSRFNEANAGAISSNLGSLCRLALVLGFMLTAFQIARMVFLAYRDKLSPMDQMPSLVVKSILIGVLLIPGVYQTLIKYAFAGPADAFANSVTVLYIDHYQDQMSAMMGKITDSASNPLSVIFSNFSGVASSVIASLVFWAACICAFILPMLQGALFLFIYYLGPVCLVFCLFDLTASVTKAWIAMMLTVCWLGFFGSVAFLVADSCSFISSVSDSASSGEVITTAVYGVISIILFCMAWPICSFFFSATGALGAVMSPTGAIASTSAGAITGVGIGATSSLLTGGFLATSGRLLKNSTNKGSTGYSFAEKLQGYGKSAIQRGADTMAITSPRAERNANAAGNMLASLGGVPFKATGSYSPTMAKKGSGAGTQKRTPPFNVKNEGELESVVTNLGRNPAPKSVEEFRTAMPYMPASLMSQVLNPFIDKDKQGELPKGLQLIPFKGENLYEAKQRIGNAINQGNDIGPMQDQAFLSNLVSEKTKIPNDARIVKNEGESFAAAALRTAKTIEDKGNEPS